VFVGLWPSVFKKATPLHQLAALFFYYSIPVDFAHL
jgi:hypothetical protein